MQAQRGRTTLTIISTPSPPDRHGLCSIRSPVFPSGFFSSYGRRLPRPSLSIIYDPYSLPQLIEEFGTSERCGVRLDHNPRAHIPPAIAINQKSKIPQWQLHFNGRTPSQDVYTASVAYYTSFDTSTHISIPT